MSATVEGQTPPASGVPRPLLLGRHRYGPDQRLVMAIVNRTPDSCYDRGSTYELGAALQRVHEVVGVGADLVDIGGVKAAPGTEVPAAEEIRRIADLIAATRDAYPDLVISVDTLLARGRRHGLRCGCRPDKRPVGRTRPEALGGGRRASGGPGVYARRWPAAAHPTAPGHLRPDASGPGHGEFDPGSPAARPYDPRPSLTHSPFARSPRHFLRSKCGLDSARRDILRRKSPVRVSSWLAIRSVRLRPRGGRAPRPR